MPGTDPLQEHPDLTIHLTDTGLLPIVSSASSDGGKGIDDALARLTLTYLTVHEIASGLGLGHLQRVTIETAGGTGLVQSYLPPASISQDGQRDGSRDGGVETVSESNPQKTLRSPALVTTVVTASLAQMAEADLAIRQLEKVGRSIQKVWVSEHSSGGGDKEQP